MHGGTLDDESRIPAIRQCINSCNYLRPANPPWFWAESNFRFRCYRNPLKGVFPDAGRKSAEAHPVLPDREKDQRLPTVGEIQTAVAAHFDVTRLDLISARRNRDLVHARQVAMWIARHTTAHSLPAIGRCFGDRDHTTVIYAITCVDRRRAADDGLEAVLRMLMENLSAT